MTTIQKVQDYTGTMPAAEQVAQAQSVIESYIGHAASGLNALDLIVFDKCVAYQTVFMIEHNVFSGGAYKSQKQDDATVTLNDSWPISPLVIVTAKQFSFSNRRISQIRYGRHVG